MRRLQRLGMMVQRRSRLVVGSTLAGVLVAHLSCFSSPENCHECVRAFDADALPDVGTGGDTSGSGGFLATGGAGGLGGVVATGGAPSTGGVPATGGATARGALVSM